MNKKGFTLVELLAVIAILAILVIIAMPNVLEMFNKAKVDAFETEVKTHVKAVSNQFITTGKLVYSNVVDGAAKLPMDGEELDYYIELDSQGNIKELNVTNGDYKIEATGTSQNPIKVEQIGDTIKSETAESGTNFEMSNNGTISDGTVTMYNKNFFLENSGGSYFKINKNNVLSFYNKDGNLELSINVIVEDNFLTINGTGVYDGKYKLSSNGHELLAEAINGLPKGARVAVEDGYCKHNTINSNGGTWVYVNIDRNNNPSLHCGTCNKSVHKDKYKIIDGVLYSHNIHIGNGWELNDAELTYSDNFYSALIWDKNLEEVHIKASIDNIPVKYLSGYQRWTDDGDLNAKTLILDMFTKAEWIEHDNYMKVYAEFQNRDYLLNLEKVVCKDGTINY